MNSNALANTSILLRSYHEQVVHGGIGAFKNYSGQINSITESVDELTNDAARTGGFEVG
ncbi:hypothetical protein predicted by Glimmer/Critica [Acetobacter senegalensis]|uniref:Uncharacterized protein n=1 Tax=Acetobacter senegalensis TaxID=446692 RepID=A0A0U5EVK5_9PROT|nr:hypothetical protein predicted by Glimmer/Critica [Acetobacter senegalensis]